MNFRINGSGNNSPAGVAGTSLYTATDPGILFNPYVSNIQYPVPGPALIPGAVSSIPQSISVATRTASATIPGAAGPTSAAGTTTTAAGPVTTSTSAKPTTTLVTVTSAPATTAPPAGGATQTKWGQCGGSGYAGPTVCASGSTCSVLNPYYAQCV